MSKKTHQEFLAIASSISAKLHSAIQAAGPIRLKRRRDVSVDVLLCRAVAGQQLSTAAAKTIWNRVVERCGDQPLISFIQASETEVLRTCGLSRAKAKSMKAIAAASEQGLLDESELAAMSTEDRTERLVALWGVGQWTADMTHIFFFGDKDVWPSGDVTVWKTFQRLIGKRRNLDRTASKFAPKRTYLALYMYQIADAENV